VTIVLKIENTNGPGGDKAAVVRSYDRNEYHNIVILEAGESCEVDVFENRMIQIDEVDSEIVPEPVVEPDNSGDGSEDDGAPKTATAGGDDSNIANPDSEDPGVKDDGSGDGSEDDGGAGPDPIDHSVDNPDALEGDDVTDETKSGLAKLFS